MSARARGLLVLALVAVTSLLAVAPGAHAAMVAVDRVPGQIYDVDATRILFRESDTAFGVKDRRTGVVTSQPLAAGRSPLGGFLTSHGLLLVTQTPTFPYANLDELRDGNSIDLGGIDSAFSLRVAGDWAVWANGTTLTRRDLATGTNQQIATDSGDGDVASNGDVAYSTTSHDVKRFRTLLPETLATGDATHWELSPRTDGTNVVWRETGPTTQPPASLRGYGPSGAFALDHSATTDYVPFPGRDYQTAGGWVAYTEQLRTPREAGVAVWLRDPGGTETAVAGGTSPVTDGAGARIGGLAPDGQLLYIQSQFDSDFIGIFTPGGSNEFVASVKAGEGAGGERGYGNHFLRLSGRWYGVFAGELRRIAAGSNVPGEFTTITSAPTGSDNPSHATFAFASTMPGAAGFECSLDDGPYAACPSPVTFSSLAHGSHTLAVRSVDGSGRVETDPAIVTWGVEQTAPAVGLDIPDGFLTNDRTPTLGGAAGTDAEDSSQVTLLIFETGPNGIGDSPVRTVHATASGGHWSATVTPALPDGHYDARAQQLDAAGNVGNAERLFDVDGTRPDATFDVSPQPALTGHRLTFDASDSHDAGGIVRYEWDLDGDGDFERDTGSSPVTHVTYPDRGDVRPAVRVTDQAGNRAVARRTVTVFPEPPPGVVGVTIDDGARFTNDPNVFVSPVWPAGAANLILSNDGGFRDAVSAPLAADVPWRLDSSGPERLPKTVYARFSPNGLTYQDDIILDETPPTVVSAEITAVDPRVAAASSRKRIYRIRLKARDRTAGVSRMQITTDRKHPGHARRYHRHVSFKATTFRIFVRVRDRAHNWSHWKLCRH